MACTEELLERIDTSWHKLRPKLIAGQLDSRLADGRTVKETLAGVAFCAHENAVAAVTTLTPGEYRPGPGPADTTGIDPAHPWARLTSNERMVSKADSCTYRLYDELLEQLP